MIDIGLDVMFCSNVTGLIQYYDVFYSQWVYKIFEASILHPKTRYHYGSFENATFQCQNLFALSNILNCVSNLYNTKLNN